MPAAWAGWPRRSKVRAADNPEQRMKGRQIAAVILIVLGALFLLANHGLIPRLGPLFAQWWPLFLIIAGVSMFIRK